MKNQSELVGARKLQGCFLYVDLSDSLKVLEEFLYFSLSELLQGA